MSALAQGFTHINQLSDNEILAREFLVKLEEALKQPVQVSVHTPDSIHYNAAKDFIGKFDKRVCEAKLKWSSPADLFKYGDALFFSGTHRRFSELSQKVDAANSARLKKTSDIERVVRKVYPQFRRSLPLEKELAEYQRFYSLDYLEIRSEPHVYSDYVGYNKKIAVVRLNMTDTLDLTYCTSQRVKDSVSNAALMDCETLAAELLRLLERKNNSAVQLTVDTLKTAGSCVCNREGRIYFGDFDRRAVSVICDAEALAKPEHYEGLAQLAGKHSSLASLHDKIRSINEQRVEKYGPEESNFYDAQIPFIMADPGSGGGTLNWGIDYHAAVARIEFERM